MSLLWEKDEACSSIWEGAAGMGPVFGREESLFSGEEEAMAVSALREGIHGGMAWGKAVVPTDRAG